MGLVGPVEIEYGNPVPYIVSDWFDSTGNGSSRSFALHRIIIQPHVIDPAPEVRRIKYPDLKTVPHLRINSNDFSELQGGLTPGKTPCDGSCRCGSCAETDEDTTMVEGLGGDASKTVGSGADCRTRSGVECDGYVSGICSPAA